MLLNLLLAIASTAANPAHVDGLPDNPLRLTRSNTPTSKQKPTSFAGLPVSFLNLPTVTVTVTISTEPEDITIA